MFAVSCGFGVKELCEKFEAYDAQNGPRRRLYHDGARTGEKNCTGPECYRLSYVIIAGWLASALVAATVLAQRTRGLRPVR